MFLRFTVFVRVIEFCDSLLQLRPAMDDGFKLSSELERTQVETEARVVLEDLLKKTLQQRALHHDGMDGEGLPRIVVDLSKRFGQ